MTSILLLIGLSAFLGGLALFLWANSSGQYDDMDGAAERILFDDPPGPPDPPQPEKR